MVDCSKCKVGSWYWIKYAFGAPNDPKTWVVALRDTDINRKGHWRNHSCCYVQDSAVTHIGPEIVRPPELRNPGIYRVEWEDGWTVARLREDGQWWIAGCASVFKEDSFFRIGDYLGPVEPPTEIVSQPTRKLPSMDQLIQLKQFAVVKANVNGINEHLYSVVRSPWKDDDDCWWIGLSWVGPCHLTCVTEIIEAPK